MRNSQLRRYAGYLFIVAISVAVISAYSATLFRRTAYQRFAAVLDRVNEVARNLIVYCNRDDFPSFLARIAVDDVRITVVRRDGVVVADTQADISKLDNHGTRPEVLAALNGAPGESKRFSATLGKNMLYVALPAFPFNGTVYVVRSSMSVQEIDHGIAGYVVRIALIGVAAFFAISALTFLSERRNIAPLTDIRNAAEAYSAGNLDYYVSVPYPDDIRVIAEALNGMASSLQLRIAEITERKNELNSVFASMIEGVVVLDANLNILRLNPAAAGIAHVDAEEARGRNLLEIFHNTEFYQFAEDTLQGGSPAEATIVFSSDLDMVLQVHGTHLLPVRGAMYGDGILLVLNDMTHLQKLENMRRDFVANVSHELKTPITAIKGYLETLADGAIDDHDTARRFLSIAAGSADRLNAIIDDLLSLSRLEQQGGDGLVLEAVSPTEPVANAIRSCRGQAAEKQITLDLECRRDVAVEMNSLLVEQAIANLIDNAVKYSDAGSTVSILIDADEQSARVSVSDEGCGIPEKDLPRLFERFYRVEKARSRQLGGTGLGLSIVKHIAIVHGGSVAVESRLGTGSVFTFEIPISQMVR